MSRQPVGNNKPSKTRNFTPPLSLLGDVIMGLRFFSRLPGGSSIHQKPEMNRIAIVLGITSFLIALLPALVLFGAIWIGLPVLLAAAIGVGVQVIITGAMAEDGLADSVDGMWGGKSPLRRLEIMKDSTLGTYGVLALILLLSIRILAIGSLASGGAMAAALLWMGAQILGRQSALWLMLVLPPARQDGIAQGTGNLSKKAFGAGAIISALLIFVLAGMFTGIIGLVILAAIVILIVGIWNRICNKLIGGYSGDLIGGLQALVEIGALCTFILFV